MTTPPRPRVERFFITAKSEIPLLKLLTAHLPACYDAQTAIIHGGVWKAKERVLDPALIIKPRETVKVHTSPFQGQTYVMPPEHIIFQNADLLVVYKPNDLNVHAVPSSIYYNLMYGVNTWLRKQGETFNAHPVTRLDRPVEGLVIFPRNSNSERRLFEAVREKEVKKWYMAALPLNDKTLAAKKKYLHIRDRIVSDGRRTHIHQKGKEAHSLFIPHSQTPTIQFYSVFIFTGRRHQIRFHAARYLAPILGDRLYGSRVRLGEEEIALMCRGYNIPYRGKTIRVRLPQHVIQNFLER